MKRRYVLVATLVASAAMSAAVVKRLRAQLQAPAYVITEIEVTDAAAFAEYAPSVQPSFAPFGGRYLARGGKTQALAGNDPKRVVVLVFDSMERALAWYSSPEYESLKPLRDRAGKARIFATEGLPP
jgi:uncharacterized protein (DUF1330 family)